MKSQPSHGGEQCDREGQMVHVSEALSLQYILDFPGISHCMLYEMSTLNHTSGVVPDRTVCDVGVPK